ncbi:START-like domain-containing protein [Flavobacteriaceae bacterium S356]|uniref:START-like domain-containing protein n=1 Tax=Asprobacillus argus TaxID=3076534 RepID=A0ABU3LCT6_9FLAO|nr:START-like domain-containing protein [Flavobacteriaceae bacterium S356]
MSKIKYEIEFPIHASPSMLYQYFSSPSGLEEWFADRVNSRGKLMTFMWDDSEEEATIVSKKQDERARYKWTESEGDDTYFEFRVQVDAITKDVSLIVTDFSDEDELEESKMLWENQIDELKHRIGA